MDLPRRLVSHWEIDSGFETTYAIKSGNGVYAFVLKGSFIVGGIVLDERDGLGISTVDSFDITARTIDSEILLMEVPMHL
jgi:hypothetical protein